MAQAASPLQTAQMEVGTTLDPHFFHLRVRYWASRNPRSLLIVWHPCLIIREAAELGGRGAVLGHGDSSTFSERFFKSVSLHIPVHPPPPPPQHLPWDQARDRWSLGDQSGISNQAIRYSHPRQQHNQTWEYTVTWQHHPLQTQSHITHSHTCRDYTYYKLLHSNTSALTLHLIMHNILIDEDCHSRQEELQSRREPCWTLSQPILTI